MFSCEPFLVDALNGEVNTLVRSIASGVDLVYVILMNNTISICILCTSFLLLALEIEIIGEHSGNPKISETTRFMGMYLFATIFPLLVLGNYVSVLRHSLGIRRNGTLLRRVVLSTILICLASIPFVICELFFDTLFVTLTVICLSIGTWYIVSIRHVALIARQQIFDLMEL